MGGIVPFAIQLLSALPGLLASGAQAIALIQSHTDALKAMVAENRSPTQDEWNALNATIGGLEVQLYAPLDTLPAPEQTPVLASAVPPAPAVTAEPAPVPVPSVEAAQPAPESVTTEVPLGGQLPGGASVTAP